MVLDKTNEITLLRRAFTQEEFNRFAALSKDDNPIHVDPEFSARTRFGKTVAHGMMLYSFLSGVLSSKLPGPGMLQISQDMMFQAPTYTDTEVRYKLGVIEANEETAKIVTNMYLPDGQLGLQGSCEVLLPGWKKGFRGLNASFASKPKSESDSYKKIKLYQTDEIRRVFTNADLDEYTSLCGDENPYIVSGAEAKKAGFKSRIIPPALLNGMFSYIYGTRLPGRGANWMKQTTYFPAAAYVDDELTAKAEVVRLRADKDLVNLNGTVTNTKGEIVCQVQSLILVKDLEMK
jgi:acyl dehydratase